MGYWKACVLLGSPQILEFILSSCGKVTPLPSHPDFGSFVCIHGETFPPCVYIHGEAFPPRVCIHGEVFQAHVCTHGEAFPTSCLYLWGSFHHLVSVSMGKLSLPYVCNFTLMHTGLNRNQFSVPCASPHKLQTSSREISADRMEILCRW